MDGSVRVCCGLTSGMLSSSTTCPRRLRMEDRRATEADGALRRNQKADDDSPSDGGRGSGTTEAGEGSAAASPDIPPTDTGEEPLDCAWTASTR